MNNGIVDNSFSNMFPNDLVSLPQLVWDLKALLLLFPNDLVTIWDLAVKMKQRWLSHCWMNLLFPVHPIIIRFLLISVVDVRNEYYVLVNFDECYQTLYRCICNVAFMSFILVDRDETGSDPEFCPISRILSLFFLGSQNRIRIRWKLISVP